MRIFLGVWFQKLGHLIQKFLGRNNDQIISLFSLGDKNKKKKRKIPTHLQITLNQAVFFFFFSTVGMLVFITAQLALQIKIHLCLLHCNLKWLPPTVTVGYYVVIYALSRNGSIAWIFKNKYMESILIVFSIANSWVMFPRFGQSSLHFSLLMKQHPLN